MKQKQGYTLRHVCGKPVVMYSGKAEGQRKVYQLSDAAAWLWHKAAEQGDFTVESLAHALCEEYDITREDALTDVAELTAQWQQEGMLE